MRKYMFYLKASQSWSRRMNRFGNNMDQINKKKIINSITFQYGLVTKELSYKRAL